MSDIPTAEQALKEAMDQAYMWSESPCDPGGNGEHRCDKVEQAIKRAQDAAVVEVLRRVWRKDDCTASRAVLELQAAEARLQGVKVKP